MCLGLPPLPSSTPQACLWEDAVGEFMKTGHWFLFVLSSHLRPFTFSSPYTPPIPWERKLDHVRVRWVRADSRLDHLLASCSKGKTGEQLWSSAFHTWQNQGPEWLANELRFMCLENTAVDPSGTSHIMSLAPNVPKWDTQFFIDFSLCTPLPLLLPSHCS